METIVLEDRSIRRNLYRVLRKTGVNKESIKPCASFSEDLHFDKVDWTIFTYFLEGVFEISVGDNIVNRFAKVDDTLLYLKAELN